jgi:hypothetical protein
MKLAHIKQIASLAEWFDGVAAMSPDPRLAEALVGLSLPMVDAPAALKRPLVVLGPGANAAERALPPGAFTAGPGRQWDFDLTLATPETLEQDLVQAVNRALAAEKRLNVLVLYNDAWTHIQSTREHLAALRDHSRHDYAFLPAQQTIATGAPRERLFSDYQEAWPAAFDFSIFDAVVWHFVLPAYKAAPRWPTDYAAPQVVEALKRFDGLKVILLQDEYDGTDTTRGVIRDTGMDLILSCLPQDHLDYAYPPEQLPGVEAIMTLPGFVPDDTGLERFALPMRERAKRIAYRARVLPHRYGTLGREKFEIGVQMRRRAEVRGVPVDIEWTEEKRIYGDDWYRFLGSARAMLATESGSNVFDFDGSLRDEEEAAQALPYEAYFAQKLAERERHPDMSTIPPKVFEAIALRTALVCFEGYYSDVIQPGVHYIALKKDYSNADLVFAQLDDIEALEAMTERAYQDIIASGRYSYRAFAEGFDRTLESRTLRGPRSEIISAPIVVRRRDAPAFEPVVRERPFEYILNTGILHGAFQRRQLEAMMARTREAEFSVLRQHTPEPPGDAQTVFEAGPEAVVCYEFWQNTGAALELDSQGARVTMPPRPWHYGAGVRLDYGGVDFEQQFAWVAIRIHSAEPDLFVGVYESAADAIAAEVAVSPGQAEREIFLPIFHGRGDLLIFRSGPEGAGASATILGVRLVTASTYTPKALAVARSLAALSPEERPWAQADATPAPPAPASELETLSTPAEEPMEPEPVQAQTSPLRRLFARLVGRR